MSTYSLTLRSEKNSRLSIAEMDNNFLYLEQLAQTGSASLTNLATDIIPAEDSVYNLGSSASQWKSLHVSGGTIYVGGVPISTHDGSLVINSINLGTTASPFILSSDNDNNNLLLNGGGYKGFYAGINRLSGSDATVTQIFISKNPNASYKNESNNNDNEDFYVTGLSGSDTVVILNIYGVDEKRPLKVKDIRKFVEKFVDIVLHTDNTLNTDLTVIRDSFYDNIGVLTSSLPTGSLYKNFIFQDRSIEYSNVPYETSGTGSGTFSFFKSDYGGYNIYGSEGGPGPDYNTNFTHGFQVDDTVTISGTALDGQSPENDATMYVTDIFNGAISTFEIKDAGTGYENGYYYLTSQERPYNWAQFYITTASGSVTNATLLWPGSGYTVDLGEGYFISGGNGDAIILVTGVRNGVIDGYNLEGKPDNRSPYRNSENPWPVMSISDGGSDQYDGGNWITTDKSITKVIGSIEEVQFGNQSDYILTVTEVISGTISVGQSIRHNNNNYEIFTGTTNGGVGTYSVGGFYTNDISEQIFTIYGINYGGGEVVESNTFGTGSSYITLYDESIFAMVAINTDIDKVWYRGDFGSDNNKQVNVIGDNNTLSLGETKVELSNKHLTLPENDTLGWMSVLGPLHNYNNDISFSSVVIDDDGNTYAVGYSNINNSLPLVVKFNKDGDLVWSFQIDSNAGDGDGHANSIKIDPANGQLVVLCEFNPDYTESLIVRIDPDGYVIRSNRLKDLNGLDPQGDIYLNDMTFNSDNELIVVGEKNTDYLEWIIGTSSVLAGSTPSTLVISPSSIDNNIPYSIDSWSIAGTGITGDEPLTSINSFGGVTGTLTPGGSSASFTILADYDNATYTIIAVDTPGTGYNINVLKPIVVPGTSLGGATPDNDATIIQTATASNGGILTANITGTVASGSGTQSFSGVTGSTIEGSGVTFDINKDQFDGQYTCSISNNGSNYVLNDIITIPGSVFGGTSSNNCILTVTNVGGSGDARSSYIGEVSISGTGSTASLYLTISPNVDFSASGTWSIYKSLNQEAYIFTENWEKTLIGDVTTDRFDSLITDSNNNIYTVGTLGSDQFYNKAIISKFNQNGDLQWTKVLNELEEDCYGKSVAIFGTNSVITTHYSDYNEKVIISKITLDGELLWQKRTNGYDSNVVIDNTDIYVSLSSYDDYYFGRNTIKLFKLNSDGVLIWNNIIGGRYDFYLESTYIKNEKIAVVGHTCVMSDSYHNGFVANLPTDGTLSLGEGGGEPELSGIATYKKGNYVIQSVTSSFYESISPQVGTHSITYTADNDLYDNGYDINNNIDKINEESGIIFGDGTKQTSIAGVIPQRYIPSTNDYYLQLSDIGKHIYRDTNSDSDLYIPTNESVPFPIGTVFTVVSGYNDVRFKANNSNVEIWGSSYNNNRNEYDNGEYYYIGYNSMATLLKIGTNKWMVTSNDLSYYD
jgi:hypothetical protein